MNDPQTGLLPVSITRRRAVAGAAGLGAAALMGARLVQAQESTPGADTATGTATGTATTGTSTTQITPAEAYQDFLGKVATNLGVADSATVDTAIRDALKAMVDDRFAAGEISANAVTDQKAAIDAADAPIKVGIGEPHGGMHGGEMHGGNGQGGRGNDNDKPPMSPDDDDTDTTGDASAATPTVTS